jgi:hypothetical protein
MILGPLTRSVRLYASELLMTVVLMVAVTMTKAGRYFAAFVLLLADGVDGGVRSHPHA